MSYKIIKNKREVLQMEKSKQKTHYITTYNFNNRDYSSGY